MIHPISRLQAGQPTASTSYPEGGVLLVRPVEQTLAALREKLGSPAIDRTLVSKKGVINNNKKFATTKKKNTYYKTAQINIRAPK